MEFPIRCRPNSSGIDDQRRTAGRNRPLEKSRSPKRAGARYANQRRLPKHSTEGSCYAVSLSDADRRKPFEPLLFRRPPRLQTPHS